MRHRAICRAAVLGLAMALCLSSTGQGEDAATPDFVKDVAPIFAAHCVTCHDDDTRDGGLSFMSREAAISGGENGPVIVTGDAAHSRLLAAVEPEDGVAEMPQDADPLSAADRDVLRRWINAGAAWPEGFRVRLRLASKLDDWWAVRPLVSPALPNVSPRARGWVRNPIDVFISAAHDEKQLLPAAEAERRTLIRRLSFDLLGLPPTPEAVARFLADDRPDAYERLVDGMLASPQYGERWARHWLDVVHFGESHGYDKDKPRMNAWPYRDYVIRAFNQDLPYGQFVREQVAGDVLAPDSADALTALGFLAAGPWDFIGHAEVPETKIDGKVARHFDRDDMIRTVLTTFNSATVGCAQCHNHKFDPISQEDYYSLQSVFAALDRTDVAYDSDPTVMRTRRELVARRRLFKAELTAARQRIAEIAGPELAELDERLAEAGKSVSPPPEHGYHSAIASRPDDAKWVIVDLGESRNISRIELIGCHDNFNNIGAGFGFPIRFQIDVANDAEFGDDSRVIATDLTEVRNPGCVPLPFDTGGVSARYVRVTATRLAERRKDYIFALAELRVLTADGTNIAAGATVSALDSVEAPPRWRRSNLTDGIYAKTGADEAEVAMLRSRRLELLSAVDPELLASESRLDDAVEQTEARLKALPAPQHVYVATVHHGSGNFRGTGPDGGLRRPLAVLIRGDVTRPGTPVEPHAPEFFPEMDSDFSELGDDEGLARAALANWLADSRNSLTWRSMANRLWQYHFGTGLVATPNDFGKMGDPPTHPELLDWLAAELRAGHQSLKRLHRLIVTSATYRQASAGNPENVGADPGNHFLWRANRRRLEAEATRDAMLAAAGRLNTEMGGPSFQDFVIEKPQHSPHYEYHLHDARDPRSHRRTVYRFTVRSRSHPLLTVLDCADPSIQVARRDETVTPQQALALMNSSLSLVLAEDFAERLRNENLTDRETVNRAFELTLGRPIAADEWEPAVEYATQHGLSNFCRMMFNLNEFVHVD